MAILAVEGRRQALIADSIGGGGDPSPSPCAVSSPRTMAEVPAVVKQTGFITRS